MKLDEIPDQWAWFNHREPDYDRAWQQRLDTLRRIRTGAVDLEALKAYYKENRVAFICDWGCTFDPRNIERDLPAVIPFILFKRQAECVAWIAERWRNREHGLIEKSRDMGISWVTVALAAHFWIFYDGMVAGFGSRTEDYVDKLDDPKSLFWKLRQFIELLPVEFKPAGYNVSAHAPFMKVVNPETGAVVVGEAGKNIGRGARAGIYFVDEAAFLEQAASVDAALSQSTNCQIHLSTVNGPGNPFYQKRHGGKWPVFVFDWRDDPRKDQAWYEDQKSKLEPEVVAQEIDRDYSASVTDSYIAGKIVTAAQARGPADVFPIGPLMVGIDVARFGNDKSVFTARQGKLCYPQVESAKADIVDTTGRALDWLRTLPEIPAQIAVDTIGIGAGVADMLRRNETYGHLVVDVNSSLQLDDGENYNLRARMWREMRDWLKGAVSIPKTPELTTDLSALRYSYKGQLLLIESKADAKKRGIKSPDRADSLALTFAYPAEKRKEKGLPQDEWTPQDDLTGY